MDKVSATLVFLLVSIWLSGQIISGTVYDKITKEPLPLANVYIANSSIGSHTDGDGFFKIDIKKRPANELTISYLGYKTLQIPIEDGLIKIYMEPAEAIATKVTIKSKNPNVRKRRMRRFKDAFLGNDKNRKYLKILNNEDILLFETDGVLRALSENPIMIRNRHLGYNIIFYLDDFRLDYEEQMTIEGHAFFSDIESFEARRAQIMKNRRKMYDRSSMKFFKELIVNRKSFEPYGIGYARMTREQEIEDFILLDTCKMKYNEEKDLYTINATLPFLVVHHDIINESKVKKIFVTQSMQMVKKEKLNHATSIFISESENITIDKSGNIVNGLEVEVLGEWATERLSKMLPIDYSQN